MVIVANTIFGAIEGRPIHWGKVIGAVVSKLATHVGKAKTIPIGPYLLHLYHYAELLSNAKMVEYNIGTTILHYGLTDEVEVEQLDFEDQEDSKQEE